MGSDQEVKELVEQICRLVEATHGHTLALFTSYSLMGTLYKEVKDRLVFPLLVVWRHAQDVIQQFKQATNAVLFAAGSCWEGVDFPGDMVSSLIIVRLPFPGSRSSQRGGTGNIPHPAGVYPGDDRPGHAEKTPAGLRTSYPHRNRHLRSEYSGQAGSFWREVSRGCSGGPP